jgi:DNA-binding CsgD family transcriptional regulator
VEPVKEQSDDSERRTSRREFMGQTRTLLLLTALASAALLENNRRTTDTTMARETEQPMGDAGKKVTKRGVRDEINVADQNIVTTVYRACEPLAAEFGPYSAPSGMTFARPEDWDESAIPASFDELYDILRRIRALMASDTRLAAQASAIREAFGDGETLQIMFRQMFPGQGPRTRRNKDGSPLLTEREVEVLREVAADRTHEEIGKRLHIAPRTVGTHLNHIYAKLNVQRPLQAVARAISMGYLDMDALDIVTDAGSNGPRNWNLFDSMVTSVPATTAPEYDATLRPLAEFGLLLMTVAGHTRFLQEQNGSIAKQRASIVCEIDGRGEVVRSFGADRLRGNCSIVIAPPHAAQQGFTPGHLYVNHLLPASDGLQTNAISEFTPDGRFVRTFGGGREIGARLTNTGGMTFHPDGRLLVPSGGWTDAILAFSNGGNSVRRFINLCSTHIAVGPDRKFYATYYSSAGYRIKIYDEQGGLETALNPSGSSVGYYSIAVDSRGHLWTLHDNWAAGIQPGEHAAEPDILELAPDGTLLRSLNAPGLASGQLTLDTQDNLYVPCQRSQDVKVYSPDGKEIRRINLRGKIAPLSVAVGEGGRAWVLGCTS